MMFSAYIQELIFNNDCVILPGLGGFVANYVSAEIDYRTGKIFPPAKHILFNSKLKTNDGVLISFVAKKEGLCYSDAALAVEKEIAGIKKKLSDGIVYEFEMVGKLYCKEGERYIFEPYGCMNFMVDNFGLPVLNLERFAKNNSIVTVDLKGKTEVSFARVFKNGIAASFAAFLVFMGGMNISDGLLNRSYMFSPVEFYSLDKVYDRLAELPEVITNGAIFGINRNMDADVIENGVSEILSDDTELMPVAEQLNVVSVDVSVNEIIPDLSYHIIIGCFSSEVNAKTLVDRLVLEGYNASLKGLSNKGLYRVSVGSYSNSNDALTALNDFKDLGLYKDAWIFNE